MHRFVGMTRSFFRSGIIQSFFGDKKRAFFAYGGIVLLMALLTLNVWGAVWAATEMSALYDTFQNTTTKEHYLYVTLRILIIYYVIFFTTDNLTLLVKSLWGSYWRKRMRHWYLRKAEASGRKIEGLSQRITDGPEKITVLVIDLGINLYRAVIALFSFVPMVWMLSVHFQLGGLIALLSYYVPWIGILDDLNIPGSLLWILMIVCFVETYFSWRLGRKLPRLEIKKQRTMALTRHLIDCLLHRAAHRSVIGLFKREIALIFGGYPLVLWKNFYNFFWGLTTLLGIGYFVAVLVTIAYGTMQQTMFAIGEIHKSLAVVPDSWSVITDLQGTMRRLREIDEELG